MDIELDLYTRGEVVKVPEVGMFVTPTNNAVSMLPYGTDCLIVEVKVQGYNLFSVTVAFRDLRGWWAEGEFKEWEDEYGELSYLYVTVSGGDLVTIPEWTSK